MISPAKIPGRYDDISIILHWVIAALILVLFMLGWYMVDLPKGSDERSHYFALHKSVGLTAALLIVARLGWRMRHGMLPLQPELPLWQRRAAAVTHYGLYVFMVLQPLTGYLSSSFAGYPTRLWGIPLPQWAEKSPHWNEFFSGLHEASSVVLLLLVVLHLGGALHHFRTGTSGLLGRMGAKGTSI